MISRDPPKGIHFPTSANDVRALRSGVLDSLPSTNTGGKVLDIAALMKDLNDLYISAKKRSSSSNPETTELKSSVRAIELREAGNEKFRRARDSEALELYTKSIATAPERSEELALAYANRSAVLFRTCRYVPCLLDINRALQSEYPKNLSKKLQERKKHCLMEIRLASEHDKKMKRIKADATEPISAKNSSRDAEWRNLCKFGNPLIPNASSKIKIESDENWGRYLVATADIEPGEILSWQRFFVLTVRADKQYRNCSHCLSRCYSLIPCPSCNQMYCSKYCRKQAFNSYHRVECKMMMYRRKNVSSSQEDDAYFTAVRMMLIGTEQGTQLRNLMKRLSMRDIFAEQTDPTNKTFSGDYLSVLRLSRTYNPSFIKLHLTPVIEAIVVLQRIAFFKGKVGCQPKEVQSDTLNGTELFTAMLLINHIVAATGNRFYINPLSSSDLINVKRDATTIVGTGVCPLHNFLNHSCDAHVNFFTRHRKHVLLALRPIKKHEQIFFSYFNSFASNPIAERTKALSSFGFTCYCKACVNQWPIEPVLMERKIEFLTENKEKAIETLTRAMVLILREDVMKLRNQEIFRILCKVRKWLYNNIKEPSVSALHCENRLFFFMMLLYDDFSREFMNAESKECIKLTLAAIRVHTLTKSLS